MASLNKPLKIRIEQIESSTRLNKLIRRKKIFVSTTNSDSEYNQR